MNSVFRNSIKIIWRYTEDVLEKMRQQFKTKRKKVVEENEMKMIKEKRAENKTKVL